MELMRVNFVFMNHDYKTLVEFHIFEIIHFSIQNKFYFISIIFRLFFSISVLSYLYHDVGSITWKRKKVTCSILFDFVLCFKCEKRKKISNFIFPEKYTNFFLVISVDLATNDKSYEQIGGSST